MIVLYTASWCKPCQQIKKMLDEAGLAYREIDVTSLDTEFTIIPKVEWPDGSTSHGFWKPDIERKIRRLAR